MTSDRDFGDLSIEAERLKRGGAGFTLVELVIVIAILGILAGVVLFSLSGTTVTAAQSACKADAKSVETSLEAYKAQFGSYPSPVTTSGTNPSTLSGSIAYYANLTAKTGGGPWLRAAPSNTTRYEVWFDSGGDVYVTGPSVASDPGDTATTLGANSNDFDISSPNVCTVVVH